MSRRPRPLSTRYRLLDHYLAEAVAPAQPVVRLSFTEVAQLLRLPTPFSATMLDQRLLKPEGKQHWRRLGFAVHVDWLTRTVVFSRLAAATEREGRA